MIPSLIDQFCFNGVCSLPLFGFLMIYGRSFSTNNILRIDASLFRIVLLDHFSIIIPRKIYNSFINYCTYVSENESKSRQSEIKFTSIVFVFLQDVLIASRKDKRKNCLKRGRM